ncbi:MAG: hypothetical protein RB296_09395, partial [Acidobacteriota bacterium]|nr:hypothetical protein [Acidobacteriota bacterium]
DDLEEPNLLLMEVKEIADYNQRLSLWTYVIITPEVFLRQPPRGRPVESRRTLFSLWLDALAFSSPSRRVSHH